jgi:hypothetical protein
MLCFTFPVTGAFTMFIRSFMAAGAISEVYNTVLHVLLSYTAFSVLMAIIAGVNSIIVGSMAAIAFYIMISIQQEILSMVEVCGRPFAG